MAAIPPLFRTDATPTEVQMKLLIGQTLSLPFAYNSPVIVLDFEVDNNGKLTGRFKDASRPRVFTFELDRESVSFKPFVTNRMDSKAWEDFSAGYSYRVDTKGRKSTDKPTCGNTSFNCGKACISLKKTCRKYPEDNKAKEQLNKTTEVARSYSKKSVKPKKEKTVSQNPLQIEKAIAAPQPVVSQPKKLIGDGSHESQPRNAQEYYDAMVKAGNEITMEEAERTATAIKDWTESAYHYIRKLQQQGVPSAEADRIERFVKNSTPFNGEVYRGINVKDEAEVMAWATENGGIVDQDSHASWSSRESKALEFAHAGAYRRTPVLIHSKVNKTGVSIQRMSKQPIEAEVLVPKGARHKVKNITKKDDIIYVEVEEI